MKAILHRFVITITKPHYNGAFVSISVTFMEIRTYIIDFSIGVVMLCSDPIEPWKHCNRIRTCCTLWGELTHFNHNLWYHEHRPTSSRRWTFARNNYNRRRRRRREAVISYLIQLPMSYPLQYSGLQQHWSCCISDDVEAILDIMNQQEARMIQTFSIFTKGWRHWLNSIVEKYLQMKIKNIPVDILSPKLIYQMADIGRPLSCPEIATTWLTVLYSVPPTQIKHLFHRRSTPQVLR